jgi:hypothetical protein
MTKIIAVLLAGVAIAHADDNRIRPTCVEDEHSRRCWVDHGPPAPRPQLSPAPMPAAEQPPPPVYVPPPPPSWQQRPPIVIQLGPLMLVIPR